MICLLVPRPATATTLPDGFQESSVVEDLDTPTAVDWAPDGRMFVAEKPGRVRVVAPNGALLPDPLLDIRDQVNDVADRGLVGLAVDKDFATNGYLYLLYARELNPLDPDSDAEMASRLTRVSVKPDNTLESPSDPETVILGNDSDQPCPEPDNTVDCIPAYKFHVVGTVRSDPSDGTLWVGSGDSHDNGVVDELSYRPYDESSYAGKILHVDRAGHGLPGHPFCTGDSDLTHVCTKIYAKGFRNPFRFTLRPGEGPVVGDVGNVGAEEIDLVEPGRNYGWPCYEGSVRNPLFESEPRCLDEYAKEGSDDQAAPPAWSYDHSEGSAAVIAGPVYRGAADPSAGTAYPSDYEGKIFVADYIRGWIKLLMVNASNEVTAVEDFATDWPTGVDLELTPDGDLAYVDIAFGGSGAVRAFAFAGQTPPSPPPPDDGGAPPPPSPPPPDDGASLPPPGAPDSPASCRRAVANLILGTNSGEALRGTEGTDVIRARLGKDTAVGRGADDCVFGEQGGDLLRGSEGTDLLRGGKGNDDLRGGRGKDVINCGAGKDTVVATRRHRDKIKPNCERVNRAGRRP